MAGYIDKLILTGITVIIFTLLGYIFFISKFSKNMKFKFYGNAIISLIVIYSLFILIVPWIYIREMVTGSEHLKKLEFDKAETHFQSALEYKRNLGILANIFNQISIIKNSTWHMEDDLGLLIAKCQQFQKEKEKKKKEDSAI